MGYVINLLRAYNIYIGYIMHMEYIISHTGVACIPYIFIYNNIYWSYSAYGTHCYPTLGPYVSHIRYRVII